MNKKIIYFLGSIPVIISCIVPVSVFASVDVSFNKETTEQFYESMIAKRVLLNEDGAEQELLEYYADQQNTQQHKRELSQVAQAINMFTDDVLGDYYQQWIDGMLDISDTGVSADTLNNKYSHSVGFYTLNGDGKPRPVTVSATDKSLTVDASDFNVEITDEIVGASERGAIVTRNRIASLSGSTYNYGFETTIGSPSVSSGRVYYYRIYDGSGIFSGMSRRQELGYVSVSPSGTNSRSWSEYIGISSSNTLPNYDSSRVYTSFPSASVGSWGSSVNLPSGDLTQKPWEYYNTTFLPWVKRVCNDAGFDYTKITPYSDGYYPPEPPTEPPTRPVIPVATIPYSPFYQIETEIYTEFVYITDESGNIVDTEIETYVENVTDETGEDEYKYKFNVPELPNFKIPDVQIPTDFSVSENVANACSGIWNCIYNFLSETGLFSVVITVLTIGLLLFILHYLGG